MGYKLICEIKTLLKTLLIILIGTFMIGLLVGMNFAARDSGDTYYTMLTIILAYLLYKIFLKGISKLNLLDKRYISEINLSCSMKIWLTCVAILFERSIKGFISPTTKPENQKLNEQLYENLDIFNILIQSGLRAPVMEELFFRGVLFITILTASSYLYNKLDNNYDYVGVIAFALISSFLFGFSHVAVALDIQNMFPYYIHGLIYTLLFVLTRDIKLPIVVHSTSNILSVLARHEYTYLIEFINVINILVIVVSTIIIFKKDKQVNDYIKWWEYKVNRRHAIKKLRYISERE
ncbi:CPBP family intramembrane metalloprotease [Staphylococcus agnetis]|uniref:CPBP family intramembrane glutamic endopeptidase n=1 Tax=Staphylococcus agnetis TaxID=985762 RepID=UPI00208F79E4|nr:type II CAAX endopeptidase family protein [Staphylococcus agnetis]MCO4346323.1 CPBP family intramembrane metalloprotease [Staphylococcus agnetis]MCO4360601.1 CPBP family intramembrane metalloprotease [Staphylococcus agnetis]